ncbi:hypothetical protein BJ508DRAFT_323722 [Ascobolus immersus RN42]|uniref:F-box domain-containing protein n=1 Tax=Ascobolus immersus RN42 TaxID=1160509 RepID=A0A3N4IF85_ASCIM|nr:hypothetical protein BJ508DRAFT_323722 [Ascobolus immersus RN42]
MSAGAATQPFSRRFLQYRSEHALHRGLGTRLAAAGSSNQKPFGKQGKQIMPFKDDPTNRIRSIMSIPTEIRILIYGHCTAFTLLQLSHTSRHLRQELNNPPLFRPPPCVRGQSKKTAARLLSRAGVVNKSFGYNDHHWHFRSKLDREKRKLLHPDPRDFINHFEYARELEYLIREFSEKYADREFEELEPLPLCLWNIKKISSPQEALLYVEQMKDSYYRRKRMLYKVRSTWQRALFIEPRAVCYTCWRASKDWKKGLVTFDERTSSGWDINEVSWIQKARRYVYGRVPFAEKHLGQRICMCHCLSFIGNKVRYAGGYAESEPCSGSEIGNESESESEVEAEVEEAESRDSVEVKHDEAMRSWRYPPQKRSREQGAISEWLAQGVALVTTAVLSQNQQMSHYPDGYTPDGWEYRRDLRHNYWPSHIDSHEAWQQSQRQQPSQAAYESSQQDLARMREGHEMPWWERQARTERLRNEPRYYESGFSLDFVTAARKNGYKERNAEMGGKECKHWSREIKDVSVPDPSLRKGYRIEARWFCPMCGLRW